MKQIQTQQDLYSPAFEHDNCGIGAVVHIKGRKSHQIVVDALKIVEKLEHRAGKDAEGKELPELNIGLLYGWRSDASCILFPVSCLLNVFLKPQRSPNGPC